MGDARPLQGVHADAEERSPASRWIRSAFTASTASTSPNRLNGRGGAHVRRPARRNVALHPRQARPDHPDLHRDHHPCLRLRPRCCRAIRCWCWPGERGVSPERYDELMHQFGFDLPIWQQYLSYVGKVLHGDFGISFSTKTPVLERFHDAVSRRRVELAFFAMHLRHRARRRRPASSRRSSAAPGSTSR